MQMRIQIVRYLGDDPQPGVVECELFGVAGKRHAFIEKVPMVSLENLTGNENTHEKARWRVKFWPDVLMQMDGKLFESRQQSRGTLNPPRPWLNLTCYLFKSSPILSII